MKSTLVFAAIILSAQARAGRQGWGGGGWSSSTTTPPPATTTGWSAPPTESPGWGTTPPPPPPETTTPGWNAPPSTGWSTPPPPPPETTTTPGWNAPPTTGWSTPPPPPPETTTPGWSTPPPAGWNAPPPSGWNAPSDVSADMSSSVGTIGQGWSEEDHSETISASGDDSTPAQATVTSTGEAYVSQSGQLSQLAALSPQLVSTLNSVTALNQAVGAEGMVVDLSGLSGSVTQHGHSVATGAAASAADSTSNVNAS